MDTDQLLAFERIVREGSFSRAARVLDISQPTISARVQALEHEIGGPLFIRSGRKITLSERGEAFLPYAQRALAVLAEGSEAAQLTEAGERGRITLGTIESLAGGFLASAIARFHRLHPSVEFFVRTGHSDQVVEMLYDGIKKLGLISWPFYNNDLKPLLHFREPLIFIVPASHVLAHQKVISLQELRKFAHPLLHFQWGLMINSQLTRIAEQAGTDIEVPVWTIRHLLLQGIGTTFLPRQIVAEDLAAGRVVEIEVSDLPISYRESALVQLVQSSPLPAVIQDFTRVLREEARDIYQAR